jgi:DNA helicase-2/ATP-dependent DNA helicase PcrA
MSSEPYTSAARDGLLADLNDTQREAVTHGTGPLLVVAGAGTGKTRVLTRRVAWLAEGGLPAYALLAITFTNKAAEVLVERLQALLPGRRVQAGTFHGFGARLLRTYGEAIGIAPDYTILDREDQRRLLKDILSDQGADGGRLKPPEVGAMISHVKNGGGGRAPLDLADGDVEALFDRVFESYRRRLGAGNLLDFDDLLLEALRLLRDDEEVGERTRRRFAHVLVDEYQDTNVVQADLLASLVGPSRNLTVVGDPDQSIYRWRGATVKNILDFEAAWPGARTVVLERNYRSTHRILEAAEHVIARNLDRHAKRLFTENEEGERLREVRCRDAEDEAEVVAGLLAGWGSEGRPWGDMAVFYRVNSLSRALELSLRAHEIPYVVVAGVEFFQRREVKDLLAYARLVENPRDEAAFGRIANTPRRGIGKQSLARLRLAASARDASLLETARSKVQGVSGRARKGLDALIELIDGARERDRTPVAPLLEWLAERSGYRQWLAEQDDALEVSRLENLNELLAFAHEFDRREEAEGGLSAFIERTALVADQDAYEADGGRVSLMSVHAAKGLEFDCVVISGAEDELFPHARSVDEAGGSEEERRIFYVAMTRARKRLALTHAARRFDWRGDAPRLPSPFLADIPAGVVERTARVRGYGLRPNAFDQPLFDGLEGLDAAGGAEPADLVRDMEGALAPGDRVRHPYFGEGRLADSQGTGPHVRVTIDFEEHGRKQLLLSHARLERIP